MYMSRVCCLNRSKLLYRINLLVFTGNITVSCVCNYLGLDRDKYVLFLRFRVVLSENLKHFISNI